MMVFEIEWLFRIAASVVAGALVGYERHTRAKEAGIRTHAIVALGACVLMIISKYGFFEYGNPDPARVAANVVTSIGFIGAGIIFVRHDVIQGLTTAAGIWTTAAIGMCFGAGMYVLGIAAACGILLIQILFSNLFVFSAPRNIMNLRIHLDRNAKVHEITDCLKQIGFRHTENTLHSDGEDGWILTTEIYTFRDIDPLTVMDALRALPAVKQAELI